MHRTFKILAFAAWAVISASAFAAPGIYTGGHGDIGVSYTDNELVWHYHLDAPAVVNGSPLGTATEFAPDEIIVQAGLNTRQQVTGTPLESYFPTSTHGYFFGYSSSTTNPYLGISTEELDDNWADGPYGSPQIDFDITNVNYTGAAANPQVLFFIPEFGILTFYNHLQGNETYPVLEFPPGLHGHFEWGFSHRGTYDITWTATGTHLIDGFKSSSGTFQFQIVPEPTSAGLVLMAVCFAIKGRGLRQF